MSFVSTTENFNNENNELFSDSPQAIVESVLNGKRESLVTYVFEKEAGHNVTVNLTQF